MHVQHNTEACWCNHSCTGKAVSITHSECVLVQFSKTVFDHKMCVLIVPTTFV